MNDLLDMLTIVICLFYVVLHNNKMSSRHIPSLGASHLIPRGVRVLTLEFFCFFQLGVEYFSSFFLLRVEFFFF